MRWNQGTALYQAHPCLADEHVHLPSSRHLMRARERLHHFTIKCSI